MLGGLLVLRRRSGTANWMQFEALYEPPGRWWGDAITTALAANDLLNSDQAFLDVRLSTCDGLQLQRTGSRTGATWTETETVF